MFEPSNREQLKVARAYCQYHRFDAAGALLVTVVRESPGDFDAWILLAQVYLQLRDYDRANDAASKAATLQSENPGAQYLLGRVHKARGQSREAEAHYRRAIAIDPAQPDVLTSLGVLLRAGGRHEEAIALYRQALSLKPDHIQANGNLGNALAALGVDPQDYHQRAQADLSAKLRQARDAATALTQSGKFDAAFKVLSAALHLAPEAADIWLSAGAAAADLGIPDSMRYFEKAVSLEPENREAVERALRSAIGCGFADDAAHYSRLAYALDPSESNLIVQKLVVPAIQSSTENMHFTRRLYRQGLDDLLAAASPRQVDPVFLLSGSFFLTYNGECDRDLQMKAAQGVLRAFPGLSVTAPHCVSPIRHAGRIRVGFISAHLRSHSIGKTTRGLIERLDREHFEVYALRITPSGEDDMTRLICRAADHAIVLPRDISAARSRIASLRLDILFYQDIGLELTSYLLAFARLAPVQCVSFGHPNTTGIPTVDYFVSNDLYELPGASAHYSEKLFLLHDLPTLAYYHKPKSPTVTLDREKFGLPKTSNIYLCPQALFKVHPEFDALIQGILRRDRLGVIACITGSYEKWTDALRQRFLRSMPDVADRIMFLPSLNMEAFLELLAVADVVLDTVHFNGMNSSLEAFAVGTPIVTLPTKLQRGRHTQAMYRKMGIVDCIAEDPEDYIRIAVRLGTDRSYALDVRDRILGRNQSLYEDSRVIQEFERFFHESISERYGPSAVTPSSG